MQSSCVLDMLVFKMYKVFTFLELLLIIAISDFAYHGRIICIFNNRAEIASIFVVPGIGVLVFVWITDNLIPLNISTGDYLLSNQRSNRHMMME